MTKSARQKQFDAVTGSLAEVLVKLKELAETVPTDPYLADAQSFLTQATVCVEKQIAVEFGATAPKPEGAKAKAKAPAT